MHSLPQPLASDSTFQRRLHAPVQGRRRQLVRSLLDHAEAHEHNLPIDQCHPARKLANKLTTCGSTPYARQAAETGELSLSLARCNSRVCPTCAKYRRADLERRIRSAVSKIDDARFLTLTLKSSDEPLRQQIDRLKACYAKLRRSKAWKAHVTGGIAIVEATYNPRLDQWHPHLHVVIDGTYWKQPAIADAWEKATRDSRIVHIKRVPSREALTRYVAKYIAKSNTPENCPDRRVAEHALAMHGLRIAQPFGTLHGALKEPTDDAPKPETHEVCPLEPLHADATSGDQRAIRLFNLTRTLARNPLPDVDHPARDQAQRQHRKAARLLRAWWRRKQEPTRVPGTPSRRNRPARGHPRDRPERLWQEPKPPPSTLCHGPPR